MTFETDVHVCVFIIVTIGKLFSIGVRRLEYPGANLAQMSHCL